MQMLLQSQGCIQKHINADVAAELGVQGHPQKVKVNVLNGKGETFETTAVECVLESLEGKSFKISALTTKLEVTRELQIGVHVLSNGHI